MTTSPPIIILPSGEIAALPLMRQKFSSQLITFLLCAALCFAILAFGAVEEWSLLILQILSAVLFVGWIGQQLARGELQVVPNPLYLPMLSFAMVVILQVTFRHSAYPFVTHVSALTYVSYCLLVFVAVQCFSSPIEQRRFVLVMSIFGILLSAFSLLQFFGTNGRIYWLRQSQFGGIPFGPYVNHNHYAGMMELLAPMPLMLSLSKAYAMPHRLLLGFGGCLMVASVFISGSRGGMIACTIQLALLGAFVISKGMSKMALLAIILFLITVVPLVFWLGQDAFIERVKTLQSPTQEAVTGYREIIVRDGLRMFRDRPLLGWGLGTFPVVYPKYRSFYTNLFVNQAHNDYLQLLDETGLLGFTAGMAFLVILYRTGLRSVSRGGRTSAAALIGCTGIVVHSLSDFNLQIPANAALFFVLCGLATSRLE